MSWNQPSAPGGFGFPSPEVPGYGSPSPGGYPPAGGYPPPPGPPGFPSPGGGYAPSYAPPPGPPPSGYPGQTAQRGYPGQQYHQSHGSYAPPPGPPPSSYAPPPGPPGQYGGYEAPQQQYAAPHMPPAGVQRYGPQFEGANHQIQQPYFQYSQCTGKKKVLTIGINYIGQSGELRGCHNDARNLVSFLCGRYGYKRDDIVILTDDSRNPRELPTKANIIQAMRWLVQGAQPNDSLFFHYSGHGGQTKDRDGDEADGFDEVIYPLDYETAGHIEDDEMHDIMVKPLPPGCRLTAIFDSCHSGSALDLPYIYSTEGKIKEPNLAAEAGKGLLGAATSYLKGDMGGVMSGVSSIFKTATGGGKKANEYAKQTRTSPADVVSFSGCKDSQTSADTVEAGQATGAMSYAFIKALEGSTQQTYQQLLQNIRAILKEGGYGQKPQLSSSHPMDTAILFIA